MDNLESRFDVHSLLREHMSVDEMTQFQPCDVLNTYTPDGVFVLQRGRVQLAAMRLLLGCQKGAPVIMSLLRHHDPEVQELVEVVAADVLAEIDHHSREMDRIFGPGENHASYVCDDYGINGHRIGVRGDGEWHFFTLRYFALWNRRNEDGSFMPSHGPTNTWLLEATYTTLHPDAVRAVFAVCVPEGESFPNLSLPVAEQSAPAEVEDRPDGRQRSRRRTKGRSSKKAAAPAQVQEKFECPICMNCSTDRRASCCSQPVCPTCFGVLRANKRRECPFCRAQPFSLA